MRFYLPLEPKNPADECRPIVEIVEELNALEEEAKTTDAALKEILKRIGV